MPYISNEFILNISLYNYYLNKLDDYIKYYKNLIEFYNKFYNTQLKNIYKYKYEHNAFNINNTSIIEEKIKSFLENEHYKKEDILYNLENIICTYDEKYDILDYYPIQKIKIDDMKLEYNKEYRYMHIKYDDYIYDNKYIYSLDIIKNQKSFNDKTRFFYVYISDIIWTNELYKKLRKFNSNRYNSRFK